jgi:hypothetical protein
MSDTEKSPDQPPDVSNSGESSTSENLIVSTRSNVADVQMVATELQQRILGIIYQRLRSPTHFQRPVFDPAEVKRSLQVQPNIAHSLSCMEDSKGQPDIIQVYKDYFLFADCSPESPEGRRGLDYLEIVQLFEIYGIGFIPQTIYKRMQKMGTFDVNSSSVVETPNELIQQGLVLVGFRGNKDATFIKIDLSKKSKDRGCRGMVKLPRIKVKS